LKKKHTRRTDPAVASGPFSFVIADHLAAMDRPRAPAAKAELAQHHDGMAPPTFAGVLVAVDARGKTLTPRMPIFRRRGTD
jgi:hypothetical protein